MLGDLIMDTLLFIEEIVTPSDSKKHIRYPFEVRNGGFPLHIEFSYSPKQETNMEKAKGLIIGGLKKYTLKSLDELEEIWQSYLPLQNLLTLSLDAPEGFRGDGHRPPSHQKIILTETTATEGFFPGKISKGQWLLTLSLHAVVTEECHLTIRIWEGDEKNEALDSL
jgi:hypothetical protein